MRVTDHIHARMQQEDENIRNLEEQLPTLQQRLELAQAHADQIEASNLLKDAASDVLNMEQPATDKDLQNAKRAERERRQEVETAERDLRISRLLRDELEKGLHTVKEHDIDGNMAKLDKRLPQIAKNLANAWLAYEKAAAEADDVKREHKRLKALMPVKGVPLSFSKPVPTIPALEQIRRKHPRDSQRHPASTLRRQGYDQQAERVTPET